MAVLFLMVVKMLKFVFSDPKQRMTLNALAEHSWVIGEDGPIPQYLCWCKRNSYTGEESNGRSGTQLTETD